MSLGNGHNSGEKPHWVLAREGINLIINNDSETANQLFLQYPDSLPMFAGYAISVFMDGLMTLEEDKINLALQVLKDLEKKCSSEQGWLKAMTSKVFNSNIDHPITLAESLETQIMLADSMLCLSLLTFMQQDITGYVKGSWVLRKSWKIYQNVHNEILALYNQKIGEFRLPDIANKSASTESIIITDTPSTEDTKQESTKSKTENGYISNITNNTIQPQIPKSQSAQFNHLPTSSSNTNIPNSTPNLNNSCNSSIASSPDSTHRKQSTTSNNSTNHVNSKQRVIKKSISVNSALSKHTKRNNSWANFSPISTTLSFSYFTSTFNLFSPKEKITLGDIDEDTIIRLMGAVSFGYGLFQLGMSLLPPSLLRLTHFLGFVGNRNNGTSCLMYARLGVDMRAPLASLALLWYYTIVRPFYALDGTNIKAGVDFASQLIDESNLEFADSALFLFFRGRVCRLKSDINSAIASFEASSSKAQREIKNLSMHEVGWCHLIQLDFQNAETTFSTLKITSRWSRHFYHYLSSICKGCYSDCSEQITNFTNSVSKGIKGNQLDDFLSRRATCCTAKENSDRTATFYKCLVYEMLYLWNSMPSCNTNNINKIIHECAGSEGDESFIEPMVGLSQLILGCAYCIQEQDVLGIERFRKCLELRKNISGNAIDSHVSAFAQYELGSVLLKSADTKEEGKHLLLTLNKYKDYDFEQRLTVRVHSILKHL